EEMKSIPRMFEARFRYEQIKFGTDSSLLTDWVIAPNTPEMMRLLKWPQQEDGHSCGPLSVAAALLLIQNIKPTEESLGIRGNNLSERGSKALRQSAIQLFLTCWGEQKCSNSVWGDPKIQKVIQKYSKDLEILFATA
ncbi:hypothetical protein BCR39DRAFT_472551, partial [Naematelia encephala]